MHGQPHIRFINYEVYTALISLQEVAVVSFVHNFSLPLFSREEYIYLRRLFRKQIPHSMRRIYKNLCSATLSASVMAANMWKNSLKNVESDNNKNLYETSLDFFSYSETVLTF